MGKFAGNFKYERDAVVRQRLRDMRKARRVSGEELGRRMRLGQSWVSKVENGPLAVTEEIIINWTKALDVPKDERIRLLDEISEASNEYVSWRKVLSHGSVQAQREFSENSFTAKFQRIFQPVLVPGLLQIPTYAEAAFREVPDLVENPDQLDIAKLVRERIDRQAMLFDADRKIEIVIMEAALHYRIASIKVMAAQMHRLCQYSELETLELFILPEDADLCAIPWSGFVMLDNRAVIIELLLGEITHTKPEDVALYAARFESFKAASLQGAEVSRFLFTLAQKYSSLAQVNG